MSDSITESELEAILMHEERVKETKHEAEVFVLKAENKDLKFQAASLQYRNVILSLYVKYGLTKEDEIDDKNGKILKGVRTNDSKKDNQDQSPDKDKEK